jgi:hypothetical protein
MGSARSHERDQQTCLDPAQGQEQVPEGSARSRSSRRHDAWASKNTAVRPLLAPPRGVLQKNGGCCGEREPGVSSVRARPRWGALVEGPGCPVVTKYRLQVGARQYRLSVILCPSCQAPSEHSSQPLAYQCLAANCQKRVVASIARWTSAETRAKAHLSTKGARS